MRYVAVNFDPQTLGEEIAEEVNKIVRGTAALAGQIFLPAKYRMPAYEYPNQLLGHILVFFQIFCELRNYVMSFRLP